MEKIVFYDSERHPIMQWHKFCFRNDADDGILRFNLSTQISIFAVSNICEINLVELQNLKGCVDSLYNQKLHKLVWISQDNLLQIELEREISGSIKQHISIKESQDGSCLMVNSSFDQTFLPELTKDINAVLEYIGLYQSYEEGLMKNLNQFFTIKLYEFQCITNSDYLRFKLELKDSFFHVITISEMSEDEFTDFKRNLNLMINQQKQKVYLNPLGEFWMIEFCKVGDEIEVKGNMNDRQFPQNNLSFRWIVSQDWLSELQKQIGKA